MARTETMTQLNEDDVKVLSHNFHQFIQRKGMEKSVEFACFTSSRLSPHYGDCSFEASGWRKRNREPSRERRRPAKCLNSQFLLLTLNTYICGRCSCLSYQLNFCPKRVVRRARANIYKCNGIQHT